MISRTSVSGLLLCLGFWLALVVAGAEEVVWPEASILAKLQQAAVRDMTNQVTLVSSNPPPTTLRGETGLSTHSTGYLFAGIAGYRYLGFLPPGLMESTNKYPLILFLHGRTMREDLPALKNYGPIRHMLDRDDSRFVVAAPTTADRNWSPARLGSFLVSFCTRVKRIDAQRIYVTGISMGGYGTWNLAAAYPQWFAAVAPLCGGGDVAAVSARLKGPATWAFHGAKDNVVPLDRSLVLVEALRRNGNPVFLSVFEEAGHDIAAMVYDRDEIYDWFLSYRNSRLVKTSPAGARE